MFALLRRPSIALMFTASLGLAGCPQPGAPDTGFTDASDTVQDTHNVMDVQHDAPPTDVPMDTSSATCSTAMLDNCNPVSNAGCMTGQACYFGGNGDGGVTSGCNTPGTITTGHACSTAEGCLPGLACLGTPGTCVKLCCGPSDNQTCRTGPGGMPGATCSIPINGVPFYGCLATQNCDWFAQDCTNGGNCQPVDSSGTTTCATAGTATDGAACGGSAGDCARGFTCIQSGDAGAAVCRQVCDPSFVTGSDAGPTPDGGVPHTCSTGFHCGQVGFPPSGGTISNFGVCIPG
jgi:hypothetical protein